MGTSLLPSFSFSLMLLCRLRLKHIKAGRKLKRKSIWLFLQNHWKYAYVHEASQSIFVPFIIVIGPYYSSSFQKRSMDWFKFDSCYKQYFRFSINHRLILLVVFYAGITWNVLFTFRSSTRNLFKIKPKFRRYKFPTKNSLSCAKLIN